MDIATDAVNLSTALADSGYWVSTSWMWTGLVLLLLLTITCVYLMLHCRRVVSDCRQTERDLRESADSFRYLVETANEGIVVVQDKRLVYLNPRMCEMTGYSEAELKALPSFMPLIDPSVREVMLANHLRRLAGEAAPQRYESLFLRKDGSSYPIELSGVAITWNGQPATLNMVTDISKRKAAEHELNQLAHYDFLTGLPNRLTLIEHLNRAVSLAERSGVPLAVIFIDLNGFKEVNDTYGHEVGDGLLQLVAQRIKPLCREADTLGRMGGDEFVLLLTQVEDMQGVQQAQARIAEAMKAPFVIHEHSLNCSASLGAAIYPQDGTSVHTLLNQADQNMYKDKHQYYEREALEMR